MSETATQTDTNMASEATGFSEKSRYIINEPDHVKRVISLEKREIIDDDVIDFGKEAAQTFFDLPRFEGERPFRRNHVIYLMTCIRRETYLPEDVILKTCIVGRGAHAAEYRINGQHTAAAILSLAEHEPSIKIKIRRIRYRVRSMEEMRALYASTDRGAARTVGNQLAAQMTGVEGYADVPHEIMRRLGEGIVMWQAGTSHLKREWDSNSRAAALSGEHRDHALAIARLLTEKTSEETRHMLRSPVIGAMFASYAIAPRIASMFWKNIRDGSGLKDSSPEHKLHKWLLTRGIRDKNRATDRTFVSGEQMYRMCIHMWNSYREGVKRVEHMKAPLNTKERPVAR